MSDEVFRLTPLDVRKQEFKKGMRGYDALAVEDFRTRVADELEKVVREKLTLEERVLQLAEQLKAFRERERALNDALVSAQQLRSESREAAEREAQAILREAEAEAEERVEGARRELERLEASGQQLALRQHAYLASLRVLVERQKAELDALADATPPSFGKVAGTIVPAEDAVRAREARKSAPKWVKSISEE